MQFPFLLDADSRRRMMTAPSGESTPMVIAEEQCAHRMANCKDDTDAFLHDYAVQDQA